VGRIQGVRDMRQNLCRYERGCRAAVAGGNYVIEGTGEFDAWLSDHSRNLQEEGQNKSLLMPDPMLMWKVYPSCENSEGSFV